jgi:hypothetical protein
MIKHSFLLFFSFIILASTIYGQESSTSDEKKILSLIERFNDEDPFVNGAAISELVAIGEPAVEYLIKSLQSEDDNVRWCSAIVLGKIAPEGVNAIPFLTTALEDKNTDVRWCSAIALGKFEGKARSAVPELGNLLNDVDRDVRWAAYISLSKIDKETINKAPEFSNVVDKLEELTPKLMSELKIPGVSISVIKNYKLEWSKSFGISDAVLQTQVNSKTMFEACSMSKPVFAFLTLKLVEQDKLNLDKPLYEYFPEQFISDDEDYSKQITARMILSHTSGMPNWRKGGEEREGPLPVYFKPGKRFNYSGEGFYYLQKVVEHISKESLETYAKRNLFDKLGFESTSFVWTENLNPRIAT